MKSKTESISLPKGITRSFTFWQDREIRFDTFTSELKLRKRAEVVIAKFSNVEDTKGNNGNDGTLLITNLRLIWFSTRKHQANLSIGLHTVQSISRQETESKLLGGVAESLHVPCKFNQNKFHFVFTAVRKAALQPSTHTKSQTKKGSELAKHIVQSKSHFSSFTASQNEESNHSTSNAEVTRNTMLEKEYSNRLYHTVQSVWRAYDSTQLYRELRVRSATIIDDDNVVLLSGEQVLEKMSGASHVSNDEGFIGTLVITNLRLVWFATQEENFNISLPYLHIIGIHCQHNKFGPTLALQTSSYVGSVVIAFRISPVEKLKEMFKIITSFWKSWAQNPILGMNTNALIQSNISQLTQNQDYNNSNILHEKQWQSAGKEEHNSISESNQIVSTLKHKRNNVQDDTTATTSVTENTMEQMEDNTNIAYNEDEDDSGGDDDSDDDNDRKTHSANWKSDFDAFALYYENEWQRGVDRRPVYDASIGLAVEKLKKGDTLQDLWSIPLPSEKNVKNRKLF